MAIASGAGTTVSEAVPETEPTGAERVVVPALAPVASPALTFATAGLVDAQVAVLVRFCVLPSE